MISDLTTKRIKCYHSDKHFSEFLPTRWWQKSTGIDVGQNYVTVTLCIDNSQRRRRRDIILSRPVGKCEFDVRRLNTVILYYCGVSVRRTPLYRRVGVNTVRPSTAAPQPFAELLARSSSQSSRSEAAGDVSDCADNDSSCVRRAAVTKRQVDPLHSCIEAKCSSWNHRC